jgi:hypothetical protein
MRFSKTQRSRRHQGSPLPPSRPPSHFIQIPGRLNDFMLETPIFVRLAQNLDEMTGRGVGLACLTGSAADSGDRRHSLERLSRWEVAVIDREVFAWCRFPRSAR